MVKIIAHKPLRGSGPPWSFVCHVCGYRFPDTITMGVLAAHFDTEHDGVAPEVDLVSESQDEC